MPRPQPKEPRDKFVSRCIRQLRREGKDQKAAVGACEGMYTTYTKKES